MQQPPRHPSGRARSKSTSAAAGDDTRRNATRKLHEDVRHELRLALDSGKVSSEESYRAMSKFVFTFGRYIKPTRIIGTLLKELTETIYSSGINAEGNYSSARIASILLFTDVWLRSMIHCESLTQNNQVLDMVRRLCRSTSSAIREAAARVYCSLVWALSNRRLKRQMRCVTTPLGSSSSSSIIGGPHAHQQRIWSLTFSALAAIMSEIEWQEFARIPFADFQGKAWSEPERFPNRAPLLRAFIDRSNNIGAWTASSILAQKTDKSKAAAFNAFIMLAAGCLEAGNFSSASSLMNGFALRALDRVKELLPVKGKYILMYNKLNDILGASHGYANYRKALEARTKAKEAFIPNCAVILKDLTFIEDANPDTADNGTRINGQKMDLLQRVFEIRHRSITQKYDNEKKREGEKDPRKKAAYAYAAQMFTRLPHLSDKELEDLSLKVRPYAAGASETSDSDSHTLEEENSSVANSQASGGALEDSDASDRVFDLPLDLSTMSDRSFLLSAAVSSPASAKLSPSVTNV